MKNSPAILLILILSCMLGSGLLHAEESGHDHDHENSPAQKAPAIPPPAASERLGITDGANQATSTIPAKTAAPAAPTESAEPVVVRKKTSKPQAEPPPPIPPEFEIDTNLVEKIYEQQTEETVLSSLFKSPKMTAQVSLVNIQTMELKNDYFTVDYKSAQSTLPIFFAQIAPISVDINRFNLALNISTGYSYRDEIYNVTTKGGVKVRDSISLQWLPISASVKGTYKLPYGATPYASVGAGNQFIRQSGTLDGISQSYWVPFTIGTGGVSWMDRSTQEGGGFSGISTGISYLASFGQDQTVDFWTMDLGVNFSM